MTTSTLAMLDQAELVQLAINASGANDSGAAIGYLKEAVSRADAKGVAHYLLGAEYAQIKMYDRAVGEMEAALALDPALSIARLQLGLLWLSSGAPEQAAGVLAALQELGAGDPLRSFGQGLSHLIGDRLADARTSLLEGIAANTSNVPLNGDMQRIVDEIDKLAAAGTPLQPQAEPEPEPDAVDGRHVLLSAYTGNSSH